MERDVPPLPRLWGKYRVEGETVLWHPLAAHCCDVGAVFRGLLSQATLRRRLAAFAGGEDLDPFQVERLSWLAVLHDIGKANHGFQRGRAGHVRPALALLCPPLVKDTLPALRWSEMTAWVDDQRTLVGLLLASLSHHGTPVCPDATSSLHARLWQTTPERDPIGWIRDLSQLAEAWFPLAFAPGGEPLPELAGFQHGFAGLVSLADWIASDEAFFPFATPDQIADRMNFARARAAEILARLGLDPTGARMALSADAVERLLGAEAIPTPAQQALATLAVPKSGSLTLIEAATGSGKTEAALIHFLHLFRMGAVDGIYFALPTRSAAVQIHRRVHQAMQRVFGAAAPAVLLAVPGYLRVDDIDGALLSRFEVQWPDSEDFPARGWAAENTKRFLAGAIVVGTIDQALMAALKIKHAHLRAAALTRHLLVVDEVHSSDPYMGRLLVTLLELMRETRGHVLLMSATLGAAMAARLFRRSAPPPLDLAESQPYPALTCDGESAPRPLTGGAELRPAKRVAMQAEPAIDDPEAVASLALSAARAGGRVLVLRNTVAGALAVQQVLEGLEGADGLIFRCEGHAAPHHARFAPADRVALDRVVEDSFGKGSAEPVVLVATQTVEQSLDIDCDLLITDLCPADVLLQRIGRLHRHRRDRPAGFAEARCHVLCPAGRDLSPLLGAARHGLGFRHGVPMAYPDLRAIEATWRQIEARPSWVLPEDNRRLVEAATHPDSLDAIVRTLGGGWRDHQAEVEGGGMAQRTLATNARLDFRVGFNALRGFDKIDGRITTRLGTDDTVVVFDPPPPGPFGAAVARLTIPGWLRPEAEARPEITGIDPLRFRLGTLALIYDRWGLRLER